MAHRAHFRVLGPLDVELDGRRLSVGGPRQRALLATLLLNRGRTTPVEQIVDAVWGHEPPASARHLVQVYVSQLRAELGGDGSIVTRPPGYAMELELHQVDAARFEGLVESARAEASPVDRLAALDDALALWRGAALADTPLHGDEQVSVARLEELRLVALEERADAALALGRHRELVPELEALVAAEPLRERFRSQLMLALYRSGRQAEALAAYRDARRYLADEVGIEPGAELRNLERRVLQQDSTLELRHGRDAASTPVRPARRRRPILVIGVVVALATAAAALAVIWARGGHDDALAAQSVGEIDPLSGAVLRDVHLSDVPAAIAADASHVWATAANRVLFEVDPSRGEVTRPIGLAAAPRKLAATPGGVWIGNGFDGTLTRVDESGFVSRPLRPEPSATGRLAVAYGAGSLWVGGQDNVLSRLDPATGRLLARMPGVATPESIAVGAGAVWVAQATRAALLRVDPRTNKVVRPIPIGGMAAAVATGAGAIWAATPENGRLWRIDARTNAVKRFIRVGPDPEFVAVAGDSVWVASGSEPRLERVDARRGSVAETLRPGGVITGLAAADGRLWVAVR